MLITSDFDVNHGQYYRLAEYSYKNDYRLVIEHKYDMTDKATKQRTFVGVLESNRATMKMLLEGHVPPYGTNSLERPERPSLNEEDMTDENFLSDYRRIRKGERDSGREVDKYKELDRLKEEYHDRLPKDKPNPVTREYITKQQQIEDEYLESLELPEWDLVESRPVDDDELWDSIESLTSEDEPAMQRAKMMNESWAHRALEEALWNDYIRPGEEFHLFAM